MEKKETIPFEVDFLGNGSFQVTQLNLLTKRSMEPTQNSDAQLSARGLHHRKREQFDRDIKNTTNIIMTSGTQNNSIQADNSEGKSLASQPKFHLFGQYFQRALAYERLGKIDKAISDYNTVLGIYPEYAPAHFNRAGLYNAQGLIDMALTGINQAITLDPANLLFRQNKSMILRQKGNYMEAINETMVIRAVQMQPSLAKELIAGNTLNIPDSAQLIIGFRDNTPIDEVSLAMDWKKKNMESVRKKECSEKRRDTSLILQPIPSSSHSQLKVQHTEAPMEAVSDDAVVDFLTDVKFFAHFASDRSIISEFSSKLSSRRVEKDVLVYQTDDTGHQFFIVLKGEIALVNDQILNSRGRNKMISDPNNKSVLKFGRGQIFGEEVVTSGKTRSIERTMNALCLQPTTLLMMNMVDYQEIAGIMTER
eukprot:CAMPEP_0119043616 /NCGR_PEP_ID=MMETSP1177-20130426/24079_1 /TAXON_ID=2985 /ORGANISM="Ochromonas sp, Strain CCMP1899" /LENGTH=422 /DNA_ID=CAMNT_0007012105 /DNA_START=134 /DNA_END=1403 /DNA_ORIENTATION=+